MAAVRVHRVDDVLIEYRVETGEGNEAVCAGWLGRRRRRGDHRHHCREKPEYDQLPHASLLSSVDHLADRSLRALVIRAGELELPGERGRVGHDVDGHLSGKLKLAGSDD